MARPSTWVSFRSWRSYELAVLCSVLAFVLSLGLRDALGSSGQFLLFLLGVILASAYGGFAAGVLATLLSTSLLVAFLLPASYQALLANPEEVVTLALFCCVGILTAGVYDQVQSARQRAAESESRLRVALDAARLGVWTVDLDRKIVMESERMAEMFGLTAAPVTFTFEEWRRHVHPDDVDRVTEEFQAATREKRDFNTEYRSLQPDGSIRWVAPQGKVLLDEKGRPVRVIGVAKEITEQKLTQEARLRLASIVESTDDAIISTTAAGLITSWNTGAERLFGYSSQEVLNGSLECFFGIEQAQWEALLDQLGGGSRIRQLETTIRSREGGNRIASWTISPIYSASAQILGASFIARDITQRRAAEEEIRRWSETLEERVRDRTVQLEEVNRELEAFSYSVSHDLRAPLRSVDGFSRILLEDYRETFDPEVVRYLDRIRNAAGRMGQLIEDLLELSRVGRQPLYRTQVDLSSLATQVTDELRRLHPHRRSDIRIEPGLTVEGDPRLLQVVLENLLGNAWKYSCKRDETVIRFGGVHTAEGPAYFVEDNGAGFDMSRKDVLFLPFQRLHTATEFEGSGIGLATVARIIHRHGGRIWAEAAVDGGATFWFTLMPANAEDGHAREADPARGG